ncbi:DUF4252 domain-containing protein [Chitinophaga arvensicola]|uniref:DUF4252 domain-containing protein n=1 Tax=Chitinophaga arvensicola TaxID=29529 RepID=A0A1I0S622_9BACT|nr:DUF4252 domain-containing protein [Chitinophaga arvensicola]SEW50811.1 protein of unknown function [Chitinophaga arvensicola]
MKSLLIAAGCLLLSATAVKAQDKSLRQFRNKYKGSAEVHTLKVGNFAFKLGSLCLSFDNTDSDAKALRHAIKNVQRVKMYTISNVKGGTVSQDDIADLKSNLQRNENFDLLMEVREKGSLVHILNKGKDDELGNVVMLVQDENEFLIVNLQTSLKMSDINELIQQFASN